MNKETCSSSEISLDSLEIQHKKNLSVKGKKSAEYVDTILVPFYEKDVLIKVPKGNKNQTTNVRKSNERNDKFKSHQSRSYLMNRDSEKNKKASYLEMFRKQFSSNTPATQYKNDQDDIRSLSPEFGDTERESIDNEIGNNPESEFYNTESYNEIYYEKLMNRELKQYFDDFMGDELQINVDNRSKSPEAVNVNNLQSVSEVSQHQRHVRRATVPPINNIRLGGLGPDMENIKPRLERARSLQRYSEKVRMENRLRIYKKAVEAENEKQAEKVGSAKRRESLEKSSKERIENKTTSYLVNRTVQEKALSMKKIYNSKSKSAGVQRKDREIIAKEKKNNKKDGNIYEEDSKLKSSELEGKQSAKASSRIKSSVRTKTINTEEKLNSEVSPVHISFLVNVGGVRPSSALKALEAQHRMYQEKVKALMETNTE